MKKRSLLIALGVIVIVVAVWSFVLLHNPPQPTLDQQVQNVAAQLKCPVCQGESVASSPATIAQQMRYVIRQQLQSGKSEQQVIQYFVDRYGSQILLTPQWHGLDLLAWIAPIALLLLGALILFSVLRSWRAAVPAAAPPDETTTPLADDEELAIYRKQLERELAEEDPIFAPQRTGMEAR